ncbi:MAG: hypothetical protein MI700_10755 [Balneolales bacterium]|nr:hypothetical protein [Balneolales bacterium]
MKKISVFFFLLFFAFQLQNASAQWTVGLGLDLLRNPYFEDVPRVQLGTEANYFFTDEVSGTVGLDFGDLGTAGIIGGRYYFTNTVFGRVRGILAEDSDFALGAGIQRGLDSRWRIEGYGDFYTVDASLGIRVGIRYRL